MTEEHNRLSQYSSNLDFQYLLTDDFPNMSLGDSSVHGKGIYIDTRMKQGDIVCPLFGLLYNLTESKIDYPKYSYQISDDMAIETNNEPGFFNHSCNPNVYVNKDWLFESMRDVNQGEEILIDYGTVDYFDYGFQCFCKSKCCRSTFDGKFSSNPRYQEQMGRYFSPYLRSKFGL